MAIAFQVTFDAADPETLSAFWQEALGYIAQPPPDGYDSWEDWALERDEIAAAAIVDPDGAGPRVFFQKVPEGKSAKNRVHLDLRSAPDLTGDDRWARLRAEAARLVALGATQLYELEQRGEFWITMQDPEGNEFCLD